MSSSFASPKGGFPPLWASHCNIAPVGRCLLSLVPQQQETKIIPFKEDVNHFPIFIKLAVTPMFYKSECGLQRQDYVRACHREDGAGMGWEFCAEDPLQKQVYFVLGVRVIRVRREEPLLPRLELYRGCTDFPLTLLRWCHRVHWFWMFSFSRLTFRGWAGSAFIPGNP